jgi:hypothetical protein
MPAVAFKRGGVRSSIYHSGRTNFVKGIQGEDV